MDFSHPPRFAESPREKSLTPSVASYRWHKIQYTNGIPEDFDVDPMRSKKSGRVFNWCKLQEWLHRYCWWKKFQTTTWDVKYSCRLQVSSGINYQSTGAGFLLSTVCKLQGWFCGVIYISQSTDFIALAAVMNCKHVLNASRFSSVSIFHSCNNGSWW